MSRSWRRWPSRRRDEAGSALIELTWLGLLLLIPLVYVVITMITVQRSAYGATEAARAAGRAYILAPDQASAAARAHEAARIAMQDQGIQLDSDDMRIVCHPDPDSCLQPGSSVEVVLALDVDLPLMPSVSGESSASIAVDASHVELYGIYREAAR
ncbi:MAG: hypothetical protein H0V02_04990 [Nocardioidaceae bacterium]|nr:hypothetical protein [Nocardioidaceae bacterium]